MIRRACYLYVQKYHIPERKIRLDAFASVLSSLHLHSTIYCQAEIACDDWALRFAALPVAVFHVVLVGECWFESSDMTTRQRLCAGDMLLLPGGEGHHIVPKPGITPRYAIRLDRDVPHGRRLLRYGDDEQELVLICGSFDFAVLPHHPLLQSLPAQVVIAGDNGRPAGHLATLFQLIAQEAQAAQLGSDLLLTRLADAVFVEMMRSWLTQHANPPPGWLNACRDPLVGKALHLIHQQPEYAWTVAELAQMVALSRSSFAARFTELVGEPPMQYLTAWRMQLAAYWLRDPYRPVQQVALGIGYETLPAFSKAFKRYAGMSPLAYRLLHLPTAPTPIVS